MAYDPVHHKNVVENLRRSYKERYGVSTDLGDSEIWDLYREWFGVESAEDPQSSDDAILEAMDELTIVKDA